MLRVNAQGYLEEGDPEAPATEPEILSSDPHAGLQPTAPQAIPFKDQVASGQISDYSHGPSTAVKSGNPFHAFVDSLANTAYRTMVGAGGSLSPEAIYNGMVNLHDATNLDPVIGGPARHDLVQGLKDTASSVYAGDPEAGGNVLGQIVEGVVAPHVLPPAIEALAKGSGVVMDGARAAAGPLGRAAQSVGRGMEAAGTAATGPALSTAPIAAMLNHPVVAGLELGLPPALRYGGRGVQALGRSLEGLDTGGSVMRGAEMYGDTAARAGSQSAGASGAMGAEAAAVPRPSPVTAADVLRDSSQLPESLRALDNPVQHGSDMYSTEATDAHTPTTAGSMRQGPPPQDTPRPSFQSDLPFDVRESVSDPNMTESPLDAAARQSTRDVHAAQPAFDVVEPHDVPQEMPTTENVNALVGGAQGAGVQSGDMPASLQALFDESAAAPATAAPAGPGVSSEPGSPRSMPDPASIEALTKDIPHSWDDPMMDRPMGSGLEIAQPEAPPKAPSVGRELPRRDEVWGPDAKDTQGNPATMNPENGLLVDPTISTPDLRKMLREAADPAMQEHLVKALRQRQYMDGSRPRSTKPRSHKVSKASP